MTKNAMIMTLYMIHDGIEANMNRKVVSPNVDNMSFMPYHCIKIAPDETRLNVKNAFPSEDWIFLCLKLQKLLIRKLLIMAISALTAFAVGFEKIMSAISMIAEPKSTTAPTRPVMTNLTNDEWENMYHKVSNIKVNDCIFDSPLRRSVKLRGVSVMRSFLLNALSRSAI